MLEKVFFNFELTLGQKLRFSIDVGSCAERDLHNTEVAGFVP